MKKVILIKNGELVLKGLNRSTFEDMLIKNMRRRLSPLGTFNFIKAQSTIIAEPQDEDVDFDEAVERIKRVFGIVAFSVAGVTEKDLEKIKEAVMEFLGDDLRSVKTFKVNAKRSDKKFQYKSPEICREVGGYILSKIPSLKVDVHNPELTVTVEVRDKHVFVHGNQIKGAGGMPVGSSGRAALLLSGGIDSPVAGYMMAKRGVKIEAVYFHAPPYTSERAKQKVIDLAKLVSEYAGEITLHIVNFTDIQMYIYDKCPHDELTIIMRRYMMKIAEYIGKETGCLSLITGESVGQVASQTMQSLVATNAVCTMPVFRPVIAFDKQDIIDIAEKINTFETSILPYEDCCTTFVAKHPVTKPELERIEKSETHLSEKIDEMFETAVSTREIIKVSPDSEE